MISTDFCPHSFSLRENLFNLQAIRIWQAWFLISPHKAYEISRHVRPLSNYGWIDWEYWSKSKNSRLMHDRWSNRSPTIIILYYVGICNVKLWGMEFNDSGWCKSPPLRCFTLTHSDLDTVISLHHHRLTCGGTKYRLFLCYLHILW